MVLIHLKKAEESLFLYSTPAQTPLNELIPSIAELYNYTLRLKRLASAGEDLVKYGPLKPEMEQGYSEEQLEELSHTSAEQTNSNGDPIPKETFIRDGHEFYRVVDPTGRRNGEAPGKEAAEIIRKTLEACLEVISKEKVGANKCLTLAECAEALNHVRGAIQIVFPSGLPAWEPVRDILEGTEDLSGTAASKEVIESSVATLWWAGKELIREKKLSDYVGRNDKTKIIAKIQRRGQSAPLREPPLTEQQQREMMAYYYKKQEEQKKLMENDDDTYLQSSWADPKALKNAFVGVKDVRWRPN